MAICSVDPPGCKDIDDALHVRELPNGNIELGVHIADVTNFLLPSTAMDDEASIRYHFISVQFSTVQITPAQSIAVQLEVHPTCITSSTVACMAMALALSW